MLKSITTFQISKSLWNQCRDTHIYDKVRGHKGDHQVTVLGSAGDVGKTVSLLLRAQSYVPNLVLHDEQDTPPAAFDLSHIPKDANLTMLNGIETMHKALKDTDVIIVAGGLVRTPEVTEQEFLTTNIQFIKMAAAGIAKLRPQPFVGVVTEPINTLVPMVAEILKSHGDYNPKKLFGITCCDALRAQALYAKHHHLKVSDCYIPVIGGHSEKTIVPLVSHALPVTETTMTERSIQEFTHMVRRSTDVIARSSYGKVPTLSAAYAALVFAKSAVFALDGTPSHIQAFVENNDFGTSFFSGLVELDHTGAGEMLRYNNLSHFECHILECSLAQLRKDIMKGKRMLEMTQL